MLQFLLLFLAVVGSITSKPVSTSADDVAKRDAVLKGVMVKVETAPALSSLTACERNMQVNCINQYGTLQYLRGTKDSPCNVRRIVACLNAEKSKRDCLVGDRGTVYYIEAFLRNIDPSKCMDDFDFYEVHQLFQTPSPKNVHEFSNTHRTFSSGDHAAGPFKIDDNETDDTEMYYGESGSGHP